MEKLKYVKTTKKEVVIFPMAIQHDSFRNLGIESAGFCHVRADKKRVDCYGESFSLSTASKPLEDSVDATTMMFGFQAAMVFDNKKKDGNE